MSLNGKGFFIWKINRIAGGNPASIASMAQAARLTHAIVKVANGSYSYNVVNGVDLVPALVAQLRARGIKVWGWQYIYGSSTNAEADKAVERVKQFNLDGFVVNAEAPFKADGMAARAEKYMQRLRLGLPNLPVGLSTYRYPSAHSAFPFAAFLKYCDLAMPQVYWQSASNSAEQLRKSYNEFQALTPSRPVVPTGSAYAYGNWTATPAQVEAFLREARAMGLPAANFWEFQTARDNDGGMWNAIAAYDWGAPAQVPVLPTYVRLKHDPQWMTDPRTAKPIRSRMESSDWNTGFNADVYPAVVPLWATPNGGEGAYKYSKAWAQFLRDSNPKVYRELERVAAGLFNSRGGQDPLPVNLSDYDGNAVAEGIGSAGNVYEVIDQKSASVQVKLVDYQSQPPKPEDLNYEDTPWLVNAFTAIARDGSLHKTLGKDATFPNLGKLGTGWVPKERVEFFPELPMQVKSRVRLNVRKGPALSNTIVDRLSPGDTVMVTKYRPQGSNVWGKIGKNRWIALLYSTPAESFYYTTWKMETAPPLALVDARPYLQRPNPGPRPAADPEPEPEPAPGPTPSPVQQPGLSGDIVGAYFAALNRGDPGVVTNLYEDPGAKLVSENRKFSGHKGIYTWHQNLLTRKLPGGKFKVLSRKKSGDNYTVKWSADSRTARVAQGKDVIRTTKGKPERIYYHYTEFDLIRK